MLSVTIKRGVILQKTLLSDSSKKDSSNQNKSAYKLVCPNDIAYNKMRAWQRAIGASKFRGIVSPAYVVMRLRRKYNSRYFHYLFRTPHFAKEAERWSYGIMSDMWSLRPEHFKMIYTPLPPKAEQSAIVKFLNHATRKLTRAIRAKQKVIALLNEQKQVIIHRAVTCGLDPDVPLKPSGIPWLGDIPKLPAPKEDDLSKGILETIDMDSYRVEKKAAMKIVLDDEDAEIEPVPIGVGGRISEPQIDLLSNILASFNQQFGTLFTDADRVSKRIKDDIAPKVAADQGYQNAKKNTPQTARIEHDKVLERVIVSLLKDDTELFKQFFQNESFRRFVTDVVFNLTGGVG